MDLREYADKALDVSKEMGWTKDWSKGGCYIHLEVSEFIESLRGKKGDPTSELGDVLFTIMSVARNYGIDPLDAIEKSLDKMRKILEDKENE